MTEVVFMKGNGVNLEQQREVAEDERYRIYRMRGNALYLLAQCAESGIGAALVTMGSEGEFEGCSVGILDGQTRTWVLNPWSGHSRAI